MKKKLSVNHINIIIGVAFILLFCYKHSSHPLLLNLCNGFFSLSIIYLCLALASHVRNYGLFKSLCYVKYRKKKNVLKKERLKENDTSPLPEKFLDFYNYTDNKYSSHWNAKPFYIISIPSFILSLIFLLIL